MSTDEDIEDWRRQTELDRTLAAFDGGEVVATAGALSVELTLPGLTSVPAAGVTAVSVRTTHRRRGILRQIMTRQLDDVVARGEPVAILTASESIIYGRFGYGLASQVVGVTIDKDRGAFSSPLADAGRLRSVDLETAGKVLPDVHDQARRRQPGDINRTSTWWEAAMADRESRRGGRSGLFCVVHEDAAGQADGYALYRFKHRWDHGLARNQVHVDDLVATDGTAYAALWRLLLDVDLADTVDAWRRPVDEPLRWVLADPRQLCTTAVTDDIWVRLLDIPRALEARHYDVEGRLVLDLADPFRPHQAGRYVLEAGPAGASCTREDAGKGRPSARRSGRGADLALGVSELGSLFLGGVRASSLARAGRVVERTPGALRRADAVFAGDPPPFCRTPF